MTGRREPWFASSTRRTVVWFSAGAASAVAARLTLADGPAVIAFTDPGAEHPDNERFLADCEKWFGQKIVRLRSRRYSSTWQVWRERRFLNSPRGALCTTELKKKVRQDFQRPDDVQVFGYTVGEEARADRFREQNPDVDLRCPLIERGLTKADCLGMVERAGVELPAMYRLGYRNNNCIGCVKGGAGYWNKIRRDFPATFADMAALEREIGATVLRFDGESVYLDDLDPDRGRYVDEPAIECSLLCVMAEQSADSANSHSETRPAATPRPVGSGHLSEEDVSEGVVAGGEPDLAVRCPACGGRIVAGCLHDLAGQDEVGATLAADCDLNPVPGVELHRRVVADDPWVSYGDVRCGICGWSTGCDCGKDHDVSEVFGTPGEALEIIARERAARHQLAEAVREWVEGQPGTDRDWAYGRVYVALAASDALDSANTSSHPRVPAGGDGT